MLVSLTVGKVDAGVAVLLTEDKRLIEFPSILLPADIHSGSIVDINVARNQHAELLVDQSFVSLQSTIFKTFGQSSPSPPVLRCRNATQTSVVLEWDPIQLAMAEMRSLSLWRNGSKAGIIPKDKLSIKISGLAIDTEYTFHIVLRTSAGQYSSERLTVRTQKMTDLTGITITPGVMAPQLKESLADTVDRIGAKMIDTVRIDTTHFVTTEPRGQQWEKAVELNVPVVVPDWIKGCEREGRIVGVRGYYLDANPSDRQIGPGAAAGGGAGGGGQPRASTATVQTVAMRDSPRIEHTPPTPERSTRKGAGADGTAAVEAEPPTPPPKPAAERLADEDRSSEPEAQSLSGTTMKGKPENARDEEDDSDDDSANTEKGDGDVSDKRAEAKSAESAAAAEPSSVRDEETAEEDGSFDEVQL